MDGRGGSKHDGVVRSRGWRKQGRNTDWLEVDEGDLAVLCTSDGAEKMDWPICFQSNVIFIESCSNLVCHACCRAIICLPSFISHRPAICYIYTVLIVHTLHPYSHYCFFMHGYFRLWRSVDECRKEKDRSRSSVIQR